MEASGYGVDLFQGIAQPTGSPVPTGRRYRSVQKKDRSGNHQLLRVSVVIEVPRLSFFKRRSNGRIDFVSPFPCPFNYGSVPALSGEDGDPLDVAVLGPRLPRGKRLRVTVRGAVGFTDLGIRDDKLVCSHQPVANRGRKLILLFFHVYAICKRFLAGYRGATGSTVCEGWVDAREVLAGACRRTTR